MKYTEKIFINRRGEYSFVSLILIKMKSEWLKSLLMLIFLMGLFVISNAQEKEALERQTEAKNVLYLSYGGPGIYFSAMYERHLLIRRNYHIGVKGGIGSSFSAVIFPAEFNIPLGAFFVYGKRMHHIDLSANVTCYMLDQYNYTENKNSKELKFLFIPSIVYRYQKPTGGFTTRAGISPVIHLNSVSHSFMPWVDVGVGWAF